MASKFIYVKLTKEWGGFAVGDVVRFGLNKGQARIDKGEGIEVPKQKAVNEPEKPSRQPKVETATAKPDSEKTVTTPEIKDKPDSEKTNTTPEINDKSPKSKSKKSK